VVRCSGSWWIGQRVDRDRGRSDAGEAAAVENDSDLP